MSESADKPGLEGAVDQLAAFDAHDPCSQNYIAHVNMESLRSAAVSLKRVADTLERVADDFGAGPDRMGFLGRLHATITDALKTPLNQYGEGIGEAIQGQLERGQR